MGEGAEPVSDTMDGVQCREKEMDRKGKCHG